MKEHQSEYQHVSVVWKSEEPPGCTNQAARDHLRQPVDIGTAGHRQQRAMIALPTTGLKWLLRWGVDKSSCIFTGCFKILNHERTRSENWRHVNMFMPRGCFQSACFGALHLHGSSQTWGTSWGIPGPLQGRSTSAWGNAQAFSSGCCGMAHSQRSWGTSEGGFAQIQEIDPDNNKVY